MEILFEKISKYKDVEIAAPIRATENAAGYDMVAAEDTIIPSYPRLMEKLKRTMNKNGVQLYDHAVFTIEEMAEYTKESGAHPTLVQTGYRAFMPDDYSCELYVRSSSPYKYWIIMGNSIGLVDADYAYSDNEGPIMFQLINLSPYDIKIQKGEAIGQAVFRPFAKTDNDAEQPHKKRNGGLGSTTVVK